MSKLKKLNIINYISENETTFNIELTYEIFGKPIGEAPIVLVNHALTGNSRIFLEFIASSASPQTMA